MYDSLSGSLLISDLKQCPPRPISKSRPVIRKGANHRTNSFTPEQENQYDTIVDIVSMPLTPCSPSRAFFPSHKNLNRSTSDNQLSLSNQSFNSGTSDCCFYITKRHDADGLPVSLSLCRILSSLNQ